MDAAMGTTAAAGYDSDDAGESFACRRATQGWMLSRMLAALPALALRLGLPGPRTHTHHTHNTARRPTFRCCALLHAMQA